MTKFSVLLVYLIFCIFFLVKPDLTFASTLSYTITTGIPGMAVTRNAVFYTTEFKVNYQSGRIIFSSNPDGTGNTQVDDVINMTILRPNGTITSFSHYYPSGFCFSLNYLIPYDLTNLFLPGENTVKVQLQDACGFFAGSSPLYLVNTNAPDPTPSPTPTSTPTPETKTPLILIPGIAGSELKVQEDTLWIDKDDGHGGKFSYIPFVN